MGLNILLFWSSAFLLGLPSKELAIWNGFLSIDCIVDATFDEESSSLGFTSYYF